MTELEKLKHLLQHWIEHNDAHVSNYTEWALRVDALGQKELSDILTQISEDSKKINALFNKAINLI